MNLAKDKAKPSSTIGKIMNKLLSLVLLTTILISHSVYAETAKSPKKTKSTDTNQMMSDDEFMKQFMQLDREVNEQKKLGKTLDEINHLLSVDKQK